MKDYDATLQSITSKSCLHTPVNHINVVPVVWVLLTGSVALMSEPKARHSASDMAYEAPPRPSA